MRDNKVSKLPSGGPNASCAAIVCCMSISALREIGPRPWYLAVYHNMAGQSSPTARAGWWPVVLRSKQSVKPAPAIGLNRGRDDFTAAQWNEVLADTAPLKSARMILILCFRLRSVALDLRARRAATERGSERRNANG